MNEPLVDTNTILAVNTLFLRGVTDPWAGMLLRHFGDLFIYCETFRFTVPTAHASCDPSQGVPFLQLISERDSRLAKPVFVKAPEPLRMKDQYTDVCFERFSEWCIPNSNRLTQWLSTHLLPEVSRVWKKQLRREVVFDLDRIKSTPVLEQLSKRLALEESSLIYAFDNVLRFPIYGKIAGSKEYYLNHPLRDAFPLPTCRLKPAQPPSVPISWHKSLARLARQLTQEEFVDLLFDLRRNVREYKLHKLDRPEDVEREVIREIAQRVQLPARLRAHGHAAALLSGVLTTLGALPALGTWSSVAGGAVAVSMEIWEGYLPRSAAKIRWLRWALTWDEEAQVDRVESPGKQ